MALKDWKKFKEKIRFGNKYEYKDSYKNNSGVILRIEKPHFREKRWNVWIGYYTTSFAKTIYSRYFKTKSEALKFAKAYMERH